MSHPVKGIDHCFALVDNLETAAAQFAALGFTLSPRGLHSEAKGSANYTIMFPEEYVELLGLIKPTEMNAARRKMLEDMGEGLHAIACRIDNAEQAARDLADLGIGTRGLNSFSRPVPLPGGGSAEAAFSTVAFTTDEVPLGTVFMCQHKTRDIVWLPELLTHANTACGLGAILAMSADPVADAARFSRLWADGQVTGDGDVCTISTGPNSAPLLVMTPDEMAAHYPEIDLSGTAQGAFTALRIKVADMAAVTTCLDKAEISGTQTALGLAVAPEHTSGTVVEFVAA